MIVNISETWSCEICRVFLFLFLNKDIALFNHWALSLYEKLLIEIYIYIYIYIIYIYIYIWKIINDFLQPTQLMIIDASIEEMQVV